MTKNPDFDQYKWRAALGTVLAVGAVVFAATTGRKGKFWWFIGGSMAGGAIGTLIDSSSKKTEEKPKI